MLDNLVYVGTYTRAGQAEGIYVFRRDPETGMLTQLHVTPDRDPSFLAFDPSKRVLFAVKEQGMLHTSLIVAEIDTERVSDDSRVALLMVRRE